MVRVFWLVFGALWDWGHERVKVSCDCPRTAIYFVTKLGTGRHDDNLAIFLNFYRILNYLVLVILTVCRQSCFHNCSSLICHNFSIFYLEEGPVAGVDRPCPAPVLKFPMV